jgi:NADPH:quinone reductase-like Zn-dependent oxidoreductase
MKAVLFYEHGSLENVQFTTVPEPEIGPDEVLLAVKAAALNRLDLWVLEGWPGLNLKLPHIMGSDGAGVVAQVGSRVTDFAVGDRVAVNPTLGSDTDTFGRRGQDNLSDNFAILGEHVDGFFAEYTAVPARNLLKMPDAANFEDAAAASLVYVTKLAKAEALGADVLINRNEEDWGKAIFKATNRRGVDIVVDNVGAATFATSLRALKRGGRLLTVGNTSGPKFEIDNRLIFGKHLSIIGSTMGTSADYETVMGLIFNGRLRPVIDSIYPLSDGVAALRRLAEGDVVGKLVLTV